MTLPVMEPDVWARGATPLEEWSRGVGEGRFSSLCLGERMAFDNPETLTLLGARAAWTRRVWFATTVAGMRERVEVMRRVLRVETLQIMRAELVMSGRPPWPNVET